MKRYDLGHHILFVLFWIEYKRSNGNVQKIEDQTFDVTKRYIETDRLMWIWAITTVDVSFRIWIVYANNIHELHSFHKTVVDVDRTKYIDVDSFVVNVFPLAIQSIKNGYPFKTVFIIFSQSLDLLAMDDVERSVSERFMAIEPLLGSDQSHYDFNVTKAGPFVIVNEEIANDGLDGNKGYKEV